MNKKSLRTLELIKKSGIVILGVPHKEYKKLKIPKTKKIIVAISDVMAILTQINFIAE